MKIIDKENLKDRTENVLLLDVRELAEFREGHIPGAICMPWGTIPDRIIGTNKAQPIIVYCRTGGRATNAGQILEQLGYTDVSLFKDGWEKWSDKN